MNQDILSNIHETKCVSLYKYGWDLNLTTIWFNKVDRVLFA